VRHQLRAQPVQVGWAVDGEMQDFAAADFVQSIKRCSHVSFSCGELKAAQSLNALNPLKRAGRFLPRKQRCRPTIDRQPGQHRKSLQVVLKIAR
jgi:hypothetical protein